jgi:hypothetical protein
VFIFLLCGFSGGKVIPNEIMYHPKQGSQYEFIGNKDSNPLNELLPFHIRTLQQWQHNDRH